MAGRRRWVVMALEQFWRDPDSVKQEEATLDPSADFDLLDEVTTETSALGIVVRTDFTDDEAWSRFLERLERGEEDMRRSMMPESSEAGPSGEGDATEDVAMRGPAQADQEEEEDSEDDEDDEDAPPRILATLSPPPTSPIRPLLSGLSNIAVLRLLLTPSLRPAPSPPKGIKHDSRNSPLVDRNGWQEVYGGEGELDIWVYDQRSNGDGSVRVVSPSSDVAVYGSATGDSWRARVDHIVDLQFSMRMSGMKIDFGGMDRWEYAERVRNIEEVEKGLSRTA